MSTYKQFAHPFFACSALFTNCRAGQPSGSLQFCVHACDNSAAAIVIDPIALATVVILTTILVFGVKESFWFNAATVVVSMVAILLCIFLGEATQACSSCS